MHDFMKGRCGVDDLSLVAGGSGVVLTLVATALSWQPLAWTALGLLLLGLLRSLSRDLAARRRENEAFRRFAVKIPGLRSMRARLGTRPSSGCAEGISRNFRRARNTGVKMWKNRKTTKYFRCKTCGTVLSVPRGKGRIRVTCPRCRTVVEKRS